MTPERWKNLKSVLEKVMETAPDGRADRLDELCGGDAELRREVESFLAFEAADDFLEQAAFASVANDLRAEPAEKLIGRQIGKYRVLRALGAGGMGIVFLAERTDGEFEQQVAVKLLRQSFFNSSAKLKFQQERRILARLRHPFIAQLLDGGTIEENTPYLVMEYVEGTPITRYAEEKNLSLGEKLELFRKVCEAVSFAHRNLIIHRDLKPDNIFITSEGVPKLLDFGIAKLMSENEIKATVTRHQALTPEYASPEQISGGAITTATDVYGLGIILYELITGQRPFCPHNGDSNQILRAISETEPVKPSVAAFRGREKGSEGASEKRSEGEEERGRRGAREKTRNLFFRERNRKSLFFSSSPFLAFSFSRFLLRSSSQLKGDLDNIVLKALKKEPERRYKSIELFAEDIRRHQTGLPVTARADTFFYRAEKFIKRNPVAFAAVLIAFLTLLGALFVSNRQAQIARLEREKAEHRFNDVRQLASSFIFEINEKIDESPIKARELLVSRAIEYLDKLAAEAEGNASLQSELAAAYEKIGDVQSEIFKPGLGDSKGSLESHQKALLMREAIFRQDEQNAAAGLELLKSYIKIGNASAMTGQTDAALDNYRRGVALGEKLSRTEPQNTQILRNASRAHAMLGQAILRSGSISEALRHYEKAVAVIRRALEITPADAVLKRNLSAYYSYAGYARMEMGAADGALELFTNALAIENEVSAADPNNVQNRANLAIALFWVGVAHREFGQMDESLVYLEKTLALQQAVYEADRANFGERNGLADCHLEIGLTHFENKKYEAAIASYEKAIGNYEAVARVDTHNTAARRQIAFTRRHLADALAAKGEIAEALSIYERLLPVAEEIAVSDPNNTDYRHDIAFCRFRMGEAFLRKNERAKALEHFSAALPLFENLVAASPENARRRADLENVKNHLANLSPKSAPLFTKISR